ncbi:MAG: mandelate racemase/muconate lactonizing enzyme family protein [Acidobacteria bacterium]|nr:mandelate racemase/muconate lactonizing enzyme family protein [Acidobacteriota bacterium]MBI3423506.1 mandelate racemase/muconate lactonizing enzyme family protein [Acidobacteriota bacterium]
MTHTRRHFLKTSAALPVFTLAQTKDRTNGLAAKLAAAMDAPVLRAELFKQPVKIAALELLKHGNHFLIRARSTDGAEGSAGAHDAVMETTYPILLKRVAPYFIGKDARQLEELIQGVYLRDSNYKWQGLPFWVCVAGVELAILDLLGKVANKPLGALLGGVVRQEIAVYRASGNRGNTPEAEIEYLQKIQAETGAQAIKYRLGARMRYDDASTKRDLALAPLVRKTFDDKMTIYADANGSYDVPMAIKIGHVLEAQKFRFMEEPVPFDYYDETKQVAEGLKISIALGEQESSLRSFRRIIENGVARIVQPDLLYFGGLTRSIKVARMAAAAGLECTPHMSGGGLGYLYIAHFASCVPNCGPHQEYKGEGETLPVECATSSLKSEKGVMKIPSGPGLGVTIDPDLLKRAVVVTA